MSPSASASKPAPPSLNKVEILSGLDAGDRIVISGTDEFNGAARVVLHWNAAPVLRCDPEWKAPGHEGTKNGQGKDTKESPQFFFVSLLYPFVPLCSRSFDVIRRPVLCVFQCDARLSRSPTC